MPNIVEKTPISRPETMGEEFFIVDFVQVIGVMPSFWEPERAGAGCFDCRCGVKLVARTYKFKMTAQR
jgi:hypothetical protein